jgi:hypothetical protein
LTRLDLLALAARLLEALVAGERPGNIFERLRFAAPRCRSCVDASRSDISEAGEGWSDSRIIKALDTRGFG